MDINKLIDGYRSFYDSHFRHNHQDSPYSKLKEGQSPKTLIVSCSDSRVDPAIITEADPGDIFVIRNVANIVPTYQNQGGGIHGVSAALEFAVKFIEVENIIILGHSNCAGVKRLSEIEHANSDFITNWVKVAAPAKQRADELAKNLNLTQAEYITACEKEVIKVSLHNLMTFPWIIERVISNSLKLYGWYFCVSTGRLFVYDPETQDFKAIV